MEFSSEEAKNQHQQNYTKFIDNESRDECCNLSTHTNTIKSNQINLNYTKTIAKQIHVPFSSSSSSTSTSISVATTRAAITKNQPSESTKILTIEYDIPSLSSSSSLSSSLSSLKVSAVILPTATSELRKSRSMSAFEFSNMINNNKSNCNIAAINNNNSDHNSPLSHSGDIDNAHESGRSMENQAAAQSPLVAVRANDTHLPATGATDICTAAIDQRFGCAHYKRRAMFVTPCCNKFYKCRFCHDENESHHFDRKTLTELICSECNTRQKVQERCQACGVRFGKYTCLICNLFDDSDKKQYHCRECGICRIGGAENFFHCKVCNMCLPIQLNIDGHRCVENVSRSHCPVCLGDIHTSRSPCHIPDCGHLLHEDCFDQLLTSGHYTCPTCQTSLLDMTALWEYLDEQAIRMPMAKKFENQRVQIFCNDCHKTSKANFHIIGLKCIHCGAYNTTQNIKRRVSLVSDEPTSA